MLKSLSIFLTLCLAATSLTGCGKREAAAGGEPSKYQSQAGLEALTKQAQSQAKTQTTVKKTKPSVPIAQVPTKKPSPGGMADVCKYFPKDLVEKAIGKPIVKVEESMFGSEICKYYTAYSQTFDHTPYGDKPGGPFVIVTYDTKDFVKDRVTNEKHGSVYTRDGSIGMDNFVVRSHANEIWLTALVLGGEKYIRIQCRHDAVKGDDLVKIARKFAEKIK